MLINSDLPLVSILIPNYNHSRYLDECITSALNQTYGNIEIILLDNSSEDDSVRVAEKYCDKGIRICRNTYNIVNRTYKVLTQLSKGKYMMLLCADDVINNTFIERAVSIMEAYPQVGYVHGERDFMKENGELIELDPFFNCSFVVPGKNMMPIYMVTTIAHPSQGIFRKESFAKIGGYDMEVDFLNADRMLWFYLSDVSDYGYIREKMSKIRVGNQTESFMGQKNFQNPILYNLTIKEMVYHAKKKGLYEVCNREKEAYERIIKEFMNYTVGMLLEKDYVCAGRYLEYIKTMSDTITETEEFILLSKMQRKEMKLDISLLETLAIGALRKKRGYEPPRDYIEIDIDEL